MFADAARAECDRYRAVYQDFPSPIEVRDDISELMVSFGRLLIPEAATFRADRVEALLHHEVGTHVVTYLNGARQPLTLLTIGLPGYDETQEGLAVLAEYLTGGLDPRRLRVLAGRVVAIAEMLDGAGFLDIFESLRTDHGIPTRTAWSIAIRVVVGGGSVKDAIYLRGITHLLEASQRAAASTRSSSASSRWTTSRWSRTCSTVRCSTRRGSVHAGWTYPAPRSASTDCARERR